MASSHPGRVTLGTRKWCFPAVLNTGLNLFLKWKLVKHSLVIWQRLCLTPSLGCCLLHWRSPPRANLVPFTPRSPSCGSFSCFWTAHFPSPQTVSGGVLISSFLCLVDHLSNFFVASNFSYQSLPDSQWSVSLFLLTSCYFPVSGFWMLERLNFAT